MNKRLTVKAESGRVLSCVLDAEQDFEEQLSVLLDIKKGYGRAVRFNEQEIRIVDYYSNETLGGFTVLSVADTTLPVSLTWTVVSVG